MQFNPINPTTMQSQPIRYGDFQALKQKYEGNPYKGTSGFYVIKRLDSEDQDLADESLVLPTFDYSHPFLLRFFREVINRIPELESGTCNPQDPTAYSKGHETFIYRDNQYRIKIHNFWGTEITLYQYAENYGFCEITGIYYDYDNNGCLPGRMNWDFKYLPIFKYFINTHKPIEPPQDCEPDPMGSLSDYE